jgi:hypothetical protein
MVTNAGEFICMDGGLARPRMTNPGDFTAGGSGERHADTQKPSQLVIFQVDTSLPHAVEMRGLSKVVNFCKYWSCCVDHQAAMPTFHNESVTPKFLVAVRCRNGNLMIRLLHFLPACSREKEGRE